VRTQGHDPQPEQLAGGLPLARLKARATVYPREPQGTPEEARKCREGAKGCQMPSATCVAPVPDASAAPAVSAADCSQNPALQPWRCRARSPGADEPEPLPANLPAGCAPPKGCRGRTPQAAHGSSVRSKDLATGRRERSREWPDQRQLQGKLNGLCNFGISETCRQILG
jgi:hypothetical protein